MWQNFNCRDRKYLSLSVSTYSRKSFLRYRLLKIECCLDSSLYKFHFFLSSFILQIFSSFETVREKCSIQNFLSSIILYRNLFTDLLYSQCLWSVIDAARIDASLPPKNRRKRVTTLFLRIFQSTINPSLFLKFNVSNIFPPLPKKSKKIITKLLEKIETQSSISSKNGQRNARSKLAFFIERHVYRTRITNLDSLAKTLFQICARVHRGVCTRVVQAAPVSHQSRSKYNPKYQL